ncbi:MAG: TIGR00730 family Rossman fold protein [Alphaproteobacteria bacterium]|nr:MAG: Rossman fold protein, TIGR00730 family [Rickettsiaceae bacterium 4572_127]
MKKICVFCGASVPKDKRFIEDAQKLGDWIGKNNHRLIYGAGNTGLMGEVAQAVLKHHNNIIGITTHQIASFEAPIDGLNTEYVDTIQTRKERMIEKSDVFVALAGGIGTIDEVSDVMVQQQIGLHSKPVIFTNTKNYYAPFDAWLKQLQNEGLISDRTKSRLNYTLAGDIEEVIQILEK